VIFYSFRFEDLSDLKCAFTLHLLLKSRSISCAEKGTSTSRTNWNRI